jgi:HJR/Mrr/RecB family endonuclease
VYEEPYFVTSYDRGFLYLGSTVSETDRDGEQVAYYDRGQLVAISTEGDRHFTEDIGFAAQFRTTDDRIIAKVTSQTYIEDGFKITDGSVLCLGLDGKERWQVDTGPPAQLYVRDPQAVVATTDNTFEVIDIPSGERTNIYDTGGSVDDFALGDGRIYYHYDTRFKGIDIQDGSEKWSIDTKGEIYDISFSEGALYTGWDSGRFDMRNPSDGSIVWEQSFTPKSNTSGYEWVVGGRLIAFYDDTIRCFLGQKAVAIDRHRRLTTPEGMAVGSQLNQLVSSGKLTSAEEAIEDGRYQAALRALDEARWRLTAIDSILGMIVLGSTYAGSRKSVSSIRRHRFEQKVDQLQAAYPIPEGGLKGLEPREILSQAEVALDSRDPGLLGDRLRIVFDDDTKYEQLETEISQYIELAPRVTRLSRNLANLDASDNVRQHWIEVLRTCIDEPETLVNRCETIDEILSRYQMWQEHAVPAFDFAGERLDTDSVFRAFRTAAVDTEGDAAARTYVDAATEFVSAADEIEETLSGYDLSEILDVARRALTTDPSSYGGASRSLSQSTELLRTAAEAERTRRSLSLKYTDESKADLKNRLQEATSNLHLSRIQELNQYIDHLASGTWQLHQLTSLSPTDFEQLVGSFYSARGYSTQVTQQSADRGIDVVARGDEETLAIQAKRYTGSNKVGRPTVQKVVGAATQAGADRAVVVTTSGFTNAAMSAAREFGPQVELINGDALVRSLTESPLSPPRSSDSRSSNTSSDSTGRRRNERRTGQSRQQQTQQARCDACGKLFRGELTRVTLPDGSTGFCCPRCEQLIDESIGTTEADTRDAAAVLGISPDASNETIESAYRKRVKECHPDASDGNREEFIRVQEAYETLAE